MERDVFQNDEQHNMNIHKLQKSSLQVVWQVDLLRLWLKVLVRTKFSWFENVTLQQTIADCSKDTRNVSSEIYHFIRRHIKHHKKYTGQILGDKCWETIDP